MSDDQFYSGKTQIAWACQALLDGRKISHRSEINEAHGWRLGAIICRLKHEFGWPIDKERGAGNVAYYFLIADADLANLRFPRSARTAAKREAAE
ncbi:hypothetical protein SAMN04488523_1013 [Sulfitobacter brevis]|uniref:Helix-turn-helix domain-containing protein n=1 Tax=Sulfitobacter brevis TaxID=74348 RepID=A0A1I1SE68_9RHOB|nr:hypothetical protein [Sulfitobacter brevis]SFD44794.1 hypothetical protein SAMN04488523_1013 [Sulfitobacter brevis]